MFKGIITMTPELAKILQGEPDAQSVDFGNLIALPQFQVWNFLESVCVCGLTRCAM
jgi:hypothetical protein